MSFRNNLSAREKSDTNLPSGLPHINLQRCGFMNLNSGSRMPVSNANGTNKLINRNVIYPIDIPHYSDSVGTPCSDIISGCDSGTDLCSDESESSAGSTLRENTIEATKALADQWDRIERTIYEEDGPKVTNLQLLEECKQWNMIHPQLRIVGKEIKLPPKKLGFRPNFQEEIIAMHYSDNEMKTDSEERISASSTDVTPQNSPRTLEKAFKLYEEKNPFYPPNNDVLPKSFYSLLQITPMQIRSPVKRRLHSSILKSDVASSKWMHNHRPDSPINPRNSAKSFISLEANSVCLDKSDRVTTARKLKPLCTPDLHKPRIHSTVNGYVSRKVSLPPLAVDDEKKKIVSAKRNDSPRKVKPVQRSIFSLKRYQ